MLSALSTETVVHKTRRVPWLLAAVSTLALHTILVAGDVAAVAAESEAVAAASMLQCKTERKTEANRPTMTNGYMAHTAQEIPSTRPYWQELKNVGELSYTADIVVGNQTLSGILDTGSYELLLFSRKCHACGTAGMYEPLPSEDFSRLTVRHQHSFGSGDTESIGAVDRVLLGGHGVDEQFFWEVVDANMPLLMEAEFNAIVGMGPPEVPLEDAIFLAGELDELLKRYRRQTTEAMGQEIQNAYRLRDVLLRSPSLIENMGCTRFSHCLLRQPGAPGYWIWDDESAKDKLGTFKEIPVLGEVSWGVNLSRVGWSGGVNDSNKGFACQDGCAALFDSGTSLIAAPTEVVYAASQELDRIGGNCERLEELPDLVMDFGGTELRLPPWSYAAQVSGEVPPELRKHFPNLPPVYRACEIMMMTMDSQTQFGPLWIFGLPFFREYYTTFDFGEYPSSREKRSIHVARSSDACLPVPWNSSHLVTYSGTTAGRVRHVDLSKLRISPSVHKMLRQGPDVQRV